MPEYRIRLVRVQRVVQDAFVTVIADDRESAIEAAYDVDTDKTEWRTQETETQNIEPDDSTLRQIALDRAANT